MRARDVVSMRVAMVMAGYVSLICTFGEPQMALSAYITTGMGTLLGLGAALFMNLKHAPARHDTMTTATHAGRTRGLTQPDSCFAPCRMRLASVDALAVFLIGLAARCKMQHAALISRNNQNACSKDSGFMSANFGNRNMFVNPIPWATPLTSDFDPTGLKFEFYPTGIIMECKECKVL